MHDLMLQQKLCYCKMVSIITADFFASDHFLVVPSKFCELYLELKTQNNRTIITHVKKLVPGFC